LLITDACRRLYQGVGWQHRLASTTVEHTSAFEIARTQINEMSSAPSDNPEATAASGEQHGRGPGRGRGKAPKNLVYHPLPVVDDEERLIKLDSAIAAAEAV